MAFWYNLKPNGRKAEQSLHGACPTLYGVKWGKSFYKVVFKKHDGSLSNNRVCKNKDLSCKGFYEKVIFVPLLHHVILGNQLYLNSLL